MDNLRKSLNALPLTVVSSVKQQSSGTFKELLIPMHEGREGQYP
ncbi:hypothetical protein FHR96_000100 [Halomonas organivorans]|uniref:Uncharacterized protein n=1 Tax=Halomonas organivorans TaxID=257772 RepID=A0A7W5BUT9_9GAMM|nr:hypothetical protein [Halomonas organivorans]